jgi:cellulose biosynthesis protein BcsQ
MKKICFHIQKGGVGKTSVAGNIAAFLAREGKKTLLVDFDPQGNASSWFCRGDLQYDIADVLAGKTGVENALYHVDESFFLLPVIAIGGALKKWSETELLRNPRAIEFLANDIEKAGFDFVIFDCSPSFSLLERSVIACGDEVINPLSPEFFSIDGIENFMIELQNIEKANRKVIKNDKIVVNLLNRSFARHRAFLAELENLRRRIFVIPQDSKIAECQIAHKSIIRFDAKAKSAPYFKTLMDSLLEP